MGSLASFYLIAIAGSSIGLIPAGAVPFAGYEQFFIALSITLSQTRNNILKLMRSKIRSCLPLLFLVQLTVVPVDAAPNTALEIFSYWTSGSKAAALKALLDLYQEQNPGVEIVNATVAGGHGSAALPVLQARLLGGNPPDTWQTHPGSELFNRYVAAGKCEPVTQLYASEFLAAAEKLKAAGVTPLAVGDPGIWTSTCLLENCLLGNLHASGWNDLCNNKNSFGSMSVRTGIEPLILLNANWPSLLPTAWENVPRKNRPVGYGLIGAANPRGISPRNVRPLKCPMRFELLLNLVDPFLDLRDTNAQMRHSPVAKLSLAGLERLINPSR